MAVLISITLIFYRACYILEGDYSAAFIAYSELMTVKLELAGLPANFDNEISSPHSSAVLTEYLNEFSATQDVTLLQIAAEKQRMLNDADAIATSSKHYFHSHFLAIDAPCRESLDLFDLARLCNPAYAAGLGPQLNANNLGNLLATLLVRGIILPEPDLEQYFKADLKSLQSELSSYLVIADTVAAAFNAIGSPVELVSVIVAFWRSALLQGELCPYTNWMKLAQFFMLFQPSSAGAERAFSILKRILERGGMERAHDDLVEGALMTSYNDDGKFECNFYKKAKANANAAAKLIAANAGEDSDADDDEVDEEV